MTFRKEISLVIVASFIQMLCSGDSYAVFGHRKAQVVEQRRIEETARQQALLQQQRAQEIARQQALLQKKRIEEESARKAAVAEVARKAAVAEREKRRKLLTIGVVPGQGDPTGSSDSRKVLSLINQLHREREKVTEQQKHIDGLRQQVVKTRRVLKDIIDNKEGKPEQKKFSDTKAQGKEDKELERKIEVVKKLQDWLRARKDVISMTSTKRLMAEIFLARLAIHHMQGKIETLESDTNALTQHLQGQQLALSTVSKEVEGLAATIRVAVAESEALVLKSSDDFGQHRANEEEVAKQNFLFTQKSLEKLEIENSIKAGKSRIRHNKIATLQQVVLIQEKEKVVRKAANDLMLMIKRKRLHVEVRQTIEKIRVRRVLGAFGDVIVGKLHQELAAKMQTKKTYDQLRTMLDAKWRVIQVQQKIIDQEESETIEAYMIQFKKILRLYKAKDKAFNEALEKHEEFIKQNPKVDPNVIEQRKKALLALHAENERMLEPKKHLYKMFAQPYESAALTLQAFSREIAKRKPVVGAISVLQRNVRKFLARVVGMHSPTTSAERLVFFPARKVRKDISVIDALEAEDIAESMNKYITNIVNKYKIIQMLGQHLRTKVRMPSSLFPENDAAYIETQFRSFSPAVQEVRDEIKKARKAMERFRVLISYAQSLAERHEAES